MARDAFDRGSKWMLQHHGKVMPLLGGINRNVSSWRALATDVVQPRQLPDGLLEVVFVGESTPTLFLVEIFTYPEERVKRQLVRDTLLVYLDRQVLPEVLVLVLHPRGKVRVPTREQLASTQGLTELKVKWLVVPLWKQSAADLLAANEVGLLPWIPLTHFDDPPEIVLQQCRQRIDQQSSGPERANLLAVSQVLTRLRYNDPGLLAIFGGSQVMIESPLIEEIVNRAKSEARHEDILRFLKGRFDSVPQEIITAVQLIVDNVKLEDLVDWAARCPNLDAFRSRLSS
jgi:hypothetical protein